MSDFDTIYDRRKTNSLKWDVLKKDLPMWVADMDFRTAPEIIDAIKEKADFGILGYGIIPDEWHQSIINWWKKPV